MRMTVLVDNNPVPNLYAEWGFSLFLEVLGQRILFDLGASDLFLRNASRLGINPLEVDSIVLSHGHYDHTWGLNVFLKQGMYRGNMPKKPTLIAHPGAVVPKYRNDGTEFGLTIGRASLEYHFQMQLSREPYWINDQTVFLGEIKRRFPFENQRPLGKTYNDQGELVEDFLLDDTALAVKTDRGLVIVSGCAHAGICNIIEYAREVCAEQRVIGVIGGFHLRESEHETQLMPTVEYLEGLQTTSIHPTHCTSLAAKIALGQRTKLQEVHVGLVLEY